MRSLRRVAIGVAVFVVLMLILDGLVGMRQPKLTAGTGEGVLRTFEDGRVYETRLAVFDDGDTPWIQSGHHFRGWYERLVRNPEVELERGGVVTPYLAVALDTPEARATMRRLIIERAGIVGFYAIRAVLLFAEVKPVRLDPRPPE